MKPPNLTTYFGRICSSFCASDKFADTTSLAELTPEKPNYDGGSWHIEGQLNERICASALYYYDSENITESFLAFRQKVTGEDGDFLMKAYDQVRILIQARDS